MRVSVCTEKMERDIWLASHDPTIVAGWARWNAKQHSSAKFVNRAILHRRRGTAREHQPHMLDIAARRANCRPNVQRPFPSRLVSGTTDRHVTQTNDFEFSFFERSHFVWFFKPPENYFEHQQTTIAKAKNQKLVRSH